MMMTWRRDGIAVLPGTDHLIGRTPRRLLTAWNAKQPAKQTSRPGIAVLNGFFSFASILEQIESLPT